MAKLDSTWAKYLLLCAVLLGYFGYLQHSYGLATGGMAAALTWSFFVLCTPVADAGFLVAFPLRLLFNVRMVWSEAVVTIVAIAIDIAALLWRPEAYATTLLTRLLHRILVQPYPYWIILILAGVGTYVSLFFGDAMVDALHQKHGKKYGRHWYAIGLMVVLYVAVFAVYTLIVKQMGLRF